MEKIRVFFCYAHEDETLLHILKKHLKPLQRQGLIDVWHDRDINAGTEWEREINAHLDAAHLVLLLISPDFMDSEYCYGIEMKKALKMHDADIARVIPIIIRPVYWNESPFSKLQALPPDGKAINSSHWHNQDEAFLEVVKGVQQTIKELLSNLQRVRSEPSEHIREELLRGKSLSEVLGSYPEIAKIVTIIFETLSEGVHDAMAAGYSFVEVIEHYPELHDLLSIPLISLNKRINEEMTAGYPLDKIIQRNPELHDLLTIPLAMLNERIFNEVASGHFLGKIIQRNPDINVEKSLIDALNTDEIGFHIFPLGLTLSISSDSSDHELKELALGSSGTAFVVIAVDPNGPAQKVGIIRGDYLIKISDQPIDDIWTISEVLNKRKKGDYITLRILRMGTLLELELDMLTPQVITILWNIWASI